MYSPARLDDHEPDQTAAEPDQTVDHELRHTGKGRAFVDRGPLRREEQTPAGPRAPDTATLLEERPVRPRARRGGGGGRGPSGVSPRPGHIPGLDGLRAIAIISVLLFHYWPTSLPGGFLGVDVFFVVSGFLITTLLLREMDQHGRIDLPAFWRRRARRLLPALVLVVVTSVSVARLVGGDLLVGIGRQTLGALTFTSNWLEIAAGASYFHSTSPILFINFWSLAVEEQFYLLWPLSLVVVLALTRTTRQRVYAVAGIGLASTLLMAALYPPGEDATRVYYGTDTHLMGLMAGAALSLAWADPRHRAGLRTRVWRRWRGLAVLGSLLALGALMRWTSDGSALTFRGGIALACVATAVLVAGLLEAPSPWRRLMSVPPLTWIGERSYGIYLWHWPIIVLAGALVPYAPGTVRGALVTLSALCTTFVLSELSLRLVERPVRRRGIRASIRSLATWVGTPWRVSRVPRLIAGVLTLLLVGTAAAVATAPEKSQTQRQIEQTEARLGTSADLAGSALPGSLRGRDDDGEPAPEGAGQESDTEGDLTEGQVLVNGAIFTQDDDGLLVPAGADLTAIGDSLVVTSADGLTYRFPGLDFVARSNRQWGDAQAVIDEALAAGTVHDNVVLHLGTNAGVDEAALRTALDALGPDRNVVVMDLYVQASFTEPSNATIRAVVSDYPNAVVGEWSSTIAGQPQDLQSDGVHPDLDGMHLYAEVVARSFDELARHG